MPDFGYEVVNGFVYGLMPSGDVERFDSAEAYEDAFTDELYELDNMFEVEWPEEWIA